MGRTGPPAPGALRGFNFGANWRDYSQKALDPQKLTKAGESLDRLSGPGGLKGRRFLDIGCGSGIFSLAAKKKGAREVVGIDVNPLCIETSRRNARAFEIRDVCFMVMSVLDEDALARLGRFDCVYAWGSLHHTSALWKAVDRAAGRVGPGGDLVLALYNRHWTSPAWRGIKKTYNLLPRVLQKCVVFLFVPVIALAKTLVTFQNPFKKERGMSFYHDVVDWVGGYPYECASRDEVVMFLKKRGFRLKKFVPASTPIGNNEYVFETVS